MRLAWVVFLLVAACGGPAASPPSAVEPAELAAILAAPLKDVRTGESFTLGGFSGKVVLVEGMAVWCPLCTDQQRQIRAALPSLGPDVVVVSLDTDPNEDEQTLKRYVERTGFDWRFAIAPRSLQSALGAAFGTHFLNPPSTPLVVISPKGEAHVTAPGIKSANDIRKLVDRYRSS